MVNSSLLISESVSALDVMFSVLFNLRLSTKAILFCFFFFLLIAFKTFLAIPLLIGNTKTRLSFAIPAGPPITAAMMQQIRCHSVCPILFDSFSNDKAKGLFTP